MPAGYAATSPRPQIVTVTSTGTATQDFFVRRTTTTTLTRTAGAASSTYGDSLTFTATVTSDAGNPNGQGTVTFRDGATTLCDQVPLSGGSASCATSSLSVDGSPHSIVAEYNGSTTSPGFSGSTSAPLSQTVTKATLTVTAVDKSRVYGTANPRSMPPSPATATARPLRRQASQAPRRAQRRLPPRAPSTPRATRSRARRIASGLQLRLHFVAGKLTVTKTLTVTANDRSKTYGQPWRWARRSSRPTA